MPPAPPAGEIALAARLAEIAARLSADLARLGAACRACGECCDLARLGARLIVTDGEYARLLDGAAKPPLAAQPGVCPWREASGACGAHARRPLGCRSYFCAGAVGPAAAEAGQRAWGEWFAACRAAGVEPEAQELLVWAREGARREEQ